MRLLFSPPDKRCWTWHSRDASFVSFNEDPYYAWQRSRAHRGVCVEHLTAHFWQARRLANGGRDPYAFNVIGNRSCENMGPSVFTRLPCRFLCQIANGITISPPKCRALKNVRKYCGIILNHAHITGFLDIIIFHTIVSFCKLEGKNSKSTVFQLWEA